MTDHMWKRIRYGSKWDPKLLLKLATRALDLKDVKSMKISFDPQHPENDSLREFWYNVTLPSSIKSNPRLKLSSEIRDDRQPPYFMAALADKRRLVFKTSGMLAVDVMRRFNRLLGNPELKGLDDEASEGRYPKKFEPF